MRPRSKYIYTITCMHGIPTYAWPKDKWPKDTKEKNRLNRQRVFGWYSSLKKVQRAIEKDGEILHEHEFMLAVIEKVAQGTHGACDIPKEWWYEWKGDHENGKFVSIVKPKELDHTIGFGIG